MWPEAIRKTTIDNKVSLSSSRRSTAKQMSDRVGEGLMVKFDNDLLY